MELRLHVEVPGAGVRGVFLNIDRERTIADLIGALVARWQLPVDNGGLGAFVRRRQGWLDPRETVGAAGLRSGDQIVLTAPDAPGAPSQDAAAHGVSQLLVTGGPQSGVHVPLPPGEHQVGRSRECDVQLGDPALSRVHLLVEVSPDGEVVVQDARSTNGSFVDGLRLTQRSILRDGQEVEVGRSLVGFAPNGASGANGAGGAPALDAQGRVPLNRPPRMVPHPPQLSHKLPPPPDKQRSIGFSLSAAILPIPIAIVLWFATQQPLMLLLTLTSPLMVLGSWLEGRWGSKRDYGAESEKFRDRVVGLNRQLGESFEAEKQYRRSLAPDLARLALRARSANPSLWERRPDDPDFLLLRLGWGDQGSLVRFELEQGGDERLRGKAEEIAAHYATQHTLPLAISLREVGSLGLAGSRAHVLGLARSLIGQVAALHSPEEVMITAAIPARQREEWGWLAWLPHLRPEASPVPGTAVAEGRIAARELIDRIVKTLDERRQASQGAYGAQAASFGPSVLVVLDGEAELPRAEVDRLLTEGPRLGVHVLWLGSTAQSLPGECGAVVEVDERSGAPRIMLPNQATTIHGFASDLADERVVQDLALALAPIHDVEAAGGAAEIPRTASLLELLELDEDVERRIAQRWQQDDGRLSARLGIAAGGLPCEISLRYDGPHALAAGMTGAGKSELLQTFVASLATAHSPERLNFILVDYKGGAAFKDCINLPHTVGFVTDLDGHLVNRALTSLRAELRRREEVLRQAGCKDLIDFEARDLARAFPSLVIVVDEFAALVSELPEFVDGMVDIAQRGRSLGIHMVLATQRPAGVINDKIRTNTNLRLSLRFSDTDDSQDVIGTKDAARPGLPRGRAFVRAGPGNLTEFQAAHASGRSVIEGGPAPIVVRDLDVAGDPVEEAGAAGGPGGGGPTDLQRVVQAVRSVNDRLQMPAPPRPWLETLPEVLPLDWLERALPDPAAVTVPLGLLDDPARQRQLPALFDLAEDGSLLIYGTSGAGKTTYLRALAASLARRLPPERLHLYGLDFATRGLRPLLGLPHCGGVVAGDEPERALRLLRMLRAEVERRKMLLASAGASTLAEYHRAGGASLPTILLLLDGYSGFKSTFDDVELGAPLDWFRELVAEGRPLGLSVVFTGDRSSAVPSQLVATVSRRLVLRMANDDEYGFLNVPRGLHHDATLPPGRGFTDHNLEIHGPIVGEDPAGNAQAAALDALGAELRSRYPDARVPQVRLLPTALSRASLPAPSGSLEAVVGLLDGDLQPARFDLGVEGHLLIAGPRRSGRTTVLLAIATSLLRAPDPAPVFALAPRRQSALATFPGLTEVAVGQDACGALTDRIVAALDGAADLDLSRGAVVLVDDGDELFEGPAGFGLETLAQRGRDATVRLAAAFETQAAHRAFSGFISQVQRDRNGILLDPDTALDGTLVGGVRLPQRRGPMPPGRANLVTGGEVLVTQIAGEA